MDHSDDNELFSGNTSGLMSGVEENSGGASDPGNPHSNLSLAERTYTDRIVSYHGISAYNERIISEMDSNNRANSSSSSSSEKFTRYDNIYMDHMEARNNVWFGWGVILAWGESIFPATWAITCNNGILAAKMQHEASKA